MGRVVVEGSIASGSKPAHRQDCIGLATTPSKIIFKNSMATDIKPAYCQKSIKLVKLSITTPSVQDYF